MNGLKAKVSRPFRGLIQGPPGGAKTGSLASLANAGYKLRVIDFDGNMEPLFQYCTDEALANMDVVFLSDKMRADAKFMMADGTPEAFNKALKLTKHWEYKDENGETVDLGRPASDWDMSHILVVDGLTGLSAACFRRTMVGMGKTPATMTDRAWGMAMNDEDAFIETITNPALPFHVIVLSHLKMVGPNDVRKEDDETTKSIKRQLANLMDTRLFPTALGRQLAMTIAGHFPVSINAEPDERVTTPSGRALTWKARDEMDVKMPSNHPDLKKGYLPVETGMLTIFNALGYQAPGFEKTA